MAASQPASPLPQPTVAAHESAQPRRSQSQGCVLCSRRSGISLSPSTPWHHGMPRAAEPPSLQQAAVGSFRLQPEQPGTRGLWHSTPLPSSAPRFRRRPRARAYSRSLRTTSSTRGQYLFPLQIHNPLAGACERFRLLRPQSRALLKLHFVALLMLLLLLLLPLLFCVVNSVPAPTGEDTSTHCSSERSRSGCTSCPSPSSLRLLCSWPFGVERFL